MFGHAAVVTVTASPSSHFYFFVHAHGLGIVKVNRMMFVISSCISISFWAPSIDASRRSNTGEMQRPINRTVTAPLWRNPVAAPAPALMPSITENGVCVCAMCAYCTDVGTDVQCQNGWIIIIFASSSFLVAYVRFGHSIQAFDSIKRMNVFCAECNFYVLACELMINYKSYSRTRRIYICTFVLWRQIANIRVIITKIRRQKTKKNKSHHKSKYSSS